MAILKEKQQITAEERETEAEKDREILSRFKTKNTNQVKTFKCLRYS
jgi:hypothetical protein